MSKDIPTSSFNLRRPLSESVQQPPQNQATQQLDPTATLTQPPAQTQRVAPPPTQSRSAISKKNQDDIGEFLEKYKSAVINALPKHITPDKILRVALTEIRRNPRLLECGRMSLVGAIIQSAQLGLLPDSLTGHAYLIPYGKECQFQVGYKGMMRLAYNSGQVTNITAQAVYNDDIFEFEYGLNPTLRHVPSMSGTRKEDNLKCVYAIAYLKNGATAYTVLTKDEILWHRSFSQAVKNPKTAKYSPWTTAFIEMAKKTAIRALCKYLPQSADDHSLSSAIALDEAAERGEQDNKMVLDIDFADLEEAEDGTHSYADSIADKIE